MIHFSLNSRSFQTNQYYQKIQINHKFQVKTMKI
jgi:hypothetical protein